MTSVKTSYDDEFSLLLAVDANTAGDVQVVPANGPLVVEPPQAEIDGEVRFSQLLAASGIVDKTQYILKLDPPEYKHLVRNEAYFLRLAGKLKIPVSQARIIEDKEGRQGLLVN